MLAATGKQLRRWRWRGMHAGRAGCAHDGPMASTCCPLLDRILQRGVARPCMCVAVFVLLVTCGYVRGC